MANQTTFGDLEMASQRRTTKRDEFLARMDSLVPFGEWCALIRPHCCARDALGSKASNQYLSSSLEFVSPD